MKKLMDPHVTGNTYLTETNSDNFYNDIKGKIYNTQLWWIYWEYQMSFTVIVGGNKQAKQETSKSDIIKWL